MFQLPNDDLRAQANELIKSRILSSFDISDSPYAQASLVKGISVEDFKAKYPSKEWDVFSFDSIKKYKEDLKKANENDLVKAESKIEEIESQLSTVVVQKNDVKKIFFVKKKV